MMSWSNPNQLGASRRSTSSLGNVITRRFGLKMNPEKCAFGVSAGQFLGFLVHERGIEIGLKSQEAVKTMKLPTTKKELQKLIGKINFVRRFISNLFGRIEPFMGLVKIKSDDEFHWGQNSSKLSMKSKNIYQSLQCWFLLSKIGRSMCTYPWVTLLLLQC